MDSDKPNNLRIQSEKKQRPQRSYLTIIIVVIVLTIIAAYFAWPKTEAKASAANGDSKTTNGVAAAASGSTTTGANSAAVSNPNDDVVLTVSGYIINRERIELSPRFMGVVTWIGVKKGDSVTNGQVVVLLDDSEYKARLAQADGGVAMSRANVSKAQLSYDRINQLSKTDIESKQAVDDARLGLEAATASLKEAEGAQKLAQTYLDWCTIRSPIDGVVLEKLVDPNELVVPQSFGGSRGPSTALFAVADPKDLQVEIDINEADLSKITMNQKCRLSPEAYSDKIYSGHVAEIAPQADRAKGTLQIKVQIENPDNFLTPELSAKVEFLKP